MRPRRTALWDISESCNLRCKFCYHLADGSKWSNLKTSEVDGKALIERLSRWNVTNIEFVGGEPLLHRGLPALVETATKCGIASTVTTNGTHLNPERFAGLVRSLHCLEISIDSLRPDYLEKIRRNVEVSVLQQFLRWATSVASAVRVIMTVTKGNLCDVEIVAALCRETGVRELKLQPVYLAEAISWRDELVLGIEQHEELEQIARKILEWNQGLEDYFGNIADCAREGKKWAVCSAFNNFVYIDVRGMIRRCPSLRAPLTSISPFQNSARVCEEMSLDCLSCFNLMAYVPFVLQR